MANLIGSMMLTLHGDDAPTEVRVQGRCDGLPALFLNVAIRDARLTISGNAQDVRDWLNAALGQVDEAMESLTVCQRRGSHNWEASGMEDGCVDCDQSPLAAPVVVSNGAPF